MSFCVFQCTFCDWFLLHSIVVREDASYDFNLCKFIETCFNMCSIIENVPCVLENYVSYAALDWNALKIEIKCIQSSVSFKAVVSLLVFCLQNLSIDFNVVLKSLAITVFYSISPFMSTKICFMHLGFLYKGSRFLVGCW